MAMKAITTDPKNTRLTGPSSFGSTSSMMTTHSPIPPTKSANASGMPRRNHMPRPEMKMPPIATAVTNATRQKASSKVNPPHSSRNRVSPRIPQFYQLQLPSHQSSAHVAASSFQGTMLGDTPL